MCADRRISAENASRQKAPGSENERLCIRADGENRQNCLPGTQRPIESFRAEGSETKMPREKRHCNGGEVEIAPLTAAL